MLEIRDVQYFPDGRSIVDCIGGRRFKVKSRGHKNGYHTAKVEFLADQPVTEERLPGLYYITYGIRVLKKLLSYNYLHVERAKKCLDMRND